MVEVEIPVDLEIQVVLVELGDCMAVVAVVAVAARMGPLLEQVEQAQTG